MKKGSVNSKRPLEITCDVLENMIKNARKIISESPNSSELSFSQAQHDLEFAKRKSKEKKCEIFYPSEEYQRCSSVFYQWTYAASQLDHCHKSGNCDDEKVDKLVNQFESNYSDFTQSDCQNRYG